nr:hypothetical protein GCM10025730_13130 [Promicromonospora thailandica]
MPGAHDRLGVRRVVDQAHLAEPVEHLDHDVLGIALAGQGLLQLTTGLLRRGQDPQDDLTGLLDRVVPADLAGLQAFGDGLAGARSAPSRRP